MRKWEHLSDFELLVYYNFYNEHLDFLVKKGLQKPNKMLADKIDYIQERIKEIDDEADIRNKEQGR